MCLHIVDNCALKRKEKQIKKVRHRQCYNRRPAYCIQKRHTQWPQKGLSYWMVKWHTCLSVHLMRLFLPNSLQMLHNDLSLLQGRRSWLRTNMHQQGFDCGVKWQWLHNGQCCSLLAIYLSTRHRRWSLVSF